MGFNTSCARVVRKLYRLSDIALVTGDDEQALWQQPSLTEQKIVERLHQWGNKTSLLN